MWKQILYTKILPFTHRSVKYPLPLGLSTKILYLFLMSPSIYIHFMEHGTPAQQGCTCTIVAFNLSCHWWWSHHCSGPRTPQERAQDHSSYGSRKMRAPVVCVTVAYRGGGVQPSPPKIRRPSKIVPNSTRLWKLLKIVEFRTPTPQDVWKNGSKILKLPPVRNCFTLAMTNKLVVVINSLKLPKIKKILRWWNEISYTKLMLPPAPLSNGYRQKIPVLSIFNWICWTPSPEQNSWLRHWFSRNV